MFLMSINFEKLEVKPRNPGKLGWESHLQGPGSFSYLVLGWQLEWECSYFINLRCFCDKLLVSLCCLIGHVTVQAGLVRTCSSYRINSCFTFLKVVLSGNTVLFSLLILGQYRINWKKKTTHTGTHMKLRHSRWYINNARECIAK